MVHLSGEELCPELELRIEKAEQNVAHAAFMLADQLASIEVYGPGLNTVERSKSMMDSAVKELVAALTTRYRYDAGQ